LPVVDPNNSYLQWGAMAGIPVMLVFLLLLSYVFWRSWRNWQTTDNRYRPLLGGGIVALIALSISSLALAGWTGQDGMASLGWLVAGLITSPFIGCHPYKKSVLEVNQRAEIIPDPIEVSHYTRQSKVCDRSDMSE
jgi:hypothetical protein